METGQPELKSTHFCRAMSMDGASVMGRKLKVMYAQPSKKQKSKPKAKTAKANETKDVIEEGI